MNCCFHALATLRLKTRINCKCNLKKQNKVILKKKLLKFTRKHMSRSLFLMKLQVGGLKLYQKWTPSQMFLNDLMNTYSMQTAPSESTWTKVCLSCINKISQQTMFVVVKQDVHWQKETALFLSYFCFKG